MFWQISIYDINWIIGGTNENRRIQHVFSLSNTRDLFLELLPQSDHLTMFMDRKQE